MLSKIQELVATFIGNISISSKMIGIWPWPLVAIGQDETLTLGNDYRLFSALIKPGDLIVTTQKKATGSNKAIPGTFKHLMVYTGSVKGTISEDNNIRKPSFLGVDYESSSKEYSPEVFIKTITHAESEGVGTFDLLDVFFHYDYMAVVRPWKTKEQQKIIVQTALEQIGKEYNFDFTITQDEPSLYCTELGLYCLKKAGIELPRPIKKMTKFWTPWKKNDVVIADYFIEKYDVVCTTVSCNDPKIVRESLIPNTIREKLLKAVDASTSQQIIIKYATKN